VPEEAAGGDTAAGDAATTDSTRRAAAARLPERIAFLGFGLIGGSVAMALRQAGCRSELVAWTPSGAGPTDGLQRGLVDRAATSLRDALAGAGVVVLAGPPQAILWTLSELAGPLRGAIAPGATITDVASTKDEIVDRAGGYQLPFVGGHPMAGRESSGVAAATADLFVDRPWVVIPSSQASDQDIAMVEALATAVGARPVRMGARDHDIAVAGISHLPLLLAAALVETVAASREGTASWPLARELAASGWRDMTRLARGDPEMGAGILATNAGPVRDRLRIMRRVLDDWIELLEGGSSSAASVRIRLEEARDALEHDEPATAT